MAKKKRCTVCNHPKVKEIEEHLLSGDMSMRKIAEAYGVTVGPLQRHKKDCISLEAQVAPAPVGPAPVTRPQPGHFMTGEEVLAKLHWLIGKAEEIISLEEKAKGPTEDDPKAKGADRKLILMAIDRIDRVSQTYIKFMELAQKNDSQKELEEWRIIGAAIWEFVDNRGLREEFESELSRRGI